MIVCSGACAFPQLLMLSGLGRPETGRARGLGINPVAEVLDVGREMRHCPASTSNDDLQAHIRATMQTTYPCASTPAACSRRVIKSAYTRRG